MARAQFSNLILSVLFSIIVPHLFPLSSSSSHQWFFKAICWLQHFFKLTLICLMYMSFHYLNCCYCGWYNSIVIFLKQYSMSFNLNIHVSILGQKSIDCTMISSTFHPLLICTEFSCVMGFLTWDDLRIHYSRLYCFYGPLP